MHRSNPARQKKNHQKSVSRKTKGEKNYGGVSTKGGGLTAGQLRERYFHGLGSGNAPVPDKVNHKRNNKKSNRNRLSVKAKLKKRREAKNK